MELKDTDDWGRVDAEKSWRGEKIIDIEVERERVETERDQNKGA